MLTSNEEMLDQLALEALFDNLIFGQGVEPEVFADL